MTEEANWEADAMNTATEDRDGYDHLAAAKQMLGVYFAGDSEGAYSIDMGASRRIPDHPARQVAVLEIIAEALIALADRPPMYQVNLGGMDE